MSALVLERTRSSFMFVAGIVRVTVLQIVVKRLC